MSRRVAFRQADLTRALKAAALAGLKVQRFEIGPDGHIVVVTGEPEPAPRNYLAEWQAKRARQAYPGEVLTDEEVKDREDIKAGTARVFGRPPRRGRAARG